jgi:hypothetical protein
MNDTTRRGFLFGAATLSLLVGVEPSAFAEDAAPDKLGPSRVTPLPACLASLRLLPRIMCRKGRR